MKLSMYERATLANQYRILETLLPDEATRYRIARQALEQGYEGFYEYVGIYPEETDPPIVREETKEIVDILDMHRALHFSYEKLEDKGDVTAEDVQFRGWDGNGETTQLAFTRWFCDEQDGPRFVELERNCRRNSCTDFNGMVPQLSRYRSMLSEFKKLDSMERIDLSLDDIRRILDAGKP